MSITPEMAALKTRLKAVWESGDYGHFAEQLEPGALEFLDRRRSPPHPLLDIGCGAGQIAIPAANAGADVTGIDIATNLVEQARERAADEGLCPLRRGDAESCPFPTILRPGRELIGAMFAPRPDRVAAEMVRVCRRSGRIVMANWIPEGSSARCSRSSPSTCRHRR